MCTYITHAEALANSSLRCNTLQHTATHCYMLQHTQLSGALANLQDISIAHSKGGSAKALERGLVLAQTQVEFQRVAVCCSMLRYVAVCCSML